MITKQIKIFIYCSAFIAACVEPIDFDLQDFELIVVDGKVSNRIGESYVRIYKTFNEEGIAKTENVPGYDVWITSGSGEEINFVEIVNGAYQLQDPNFTGSVGEVYQLHIIDPNDNLITSSMDTLPSASDFELVVNDTSRLVESSGDLLKKRFKDVMIRINPNTDGYYSKFTFSYNYLDFFDGSSMTSSPDEWFSLFQCGSTECNKLTTEIIYMQQDRDWRFFNETDTCLSLWNNPEAPTPSCESVPTCCQMFDAYDTEFAVLQETLSRKSYSFWENVDRLRSNDGLVFDTFPFPINGNISCESCTYDIVGQFSAVEVIAKTQSVVL